MNKIKTLLVVLLMTSAFVIKAQSHKKISPPKATVKNADQPPSLKNFFTKNSTVANVHWKVENNIVIKLKNGKTQTYNLGNLQETDTFEKNYGTPPTVPPPPPSEKKLQFN